MPWIRVTDEFMPLFDYIMVIFMIIAFYSVAVFVASLTGTPEELEEAMLHGIRAAKDVVIALGFLAIRNLFKTVTSVLNELKATVKCRLWSVST